MTPGPAAVKMPHRTLGRTDDAESMQALHAAFDAVATVIPGIAGSGTSTSNPR